MDLRKQILTILTLVVVLLIPVYVSGYFPMQNSEGVSISARILTSEDDRAGMWDHFGPSAGNGNQDNRDWNWELRIKSKETKTIRRITIIHNRRGEVWSTGYSRYLADATDLYGYRENPYPLVAASHSESPAWNKRYDDELPTVIPPEFTTLLFGQRESLTFEGAKIIVEFTDGSSSKAEIFPLEEGIAL